MHSEKYFVVQLTANDLEMIGAYILLLIPRMNDRKSSL